MKAIFAVSALAAAIASAPAFAADTEATTTFNGAMEVYFELDLENETKDVELEKGDDANDGGSYGLYMDVDVKNGPFSGTVGIKQEDGAGDVTLGDIKVTDGKISFGQVGSLISTHEYTFEMGDFGDSGKDVDAAFRYNVMEGFDVQVEGAQQDGAGDDYGLAAKYSGEAGAVAYVADVQLRGSDTQAALNPDAQLYTYAGAGVTFTSDLVTVKAGLNSAASGANNDERVNEYGVSVTSSPVEALTLGFHIQDSNLDTDKDASMRYKAEAKFVAGAITASGYYAATDSETDADKINAKVEYAQDAISGYAGVTLNNDYVDGAEPLIEAGVSYTVESGIVYAADYTLQSEATNEVQLSAKYSF